MVDNARLRGIISESGYKKSFIAQQMGITNSSLSNKLAGRCRWTADECSFLREFFGMPTEEAMNIFFGDEVGKKPTAKAD